MLVGTCLRDLIVTLVYFEVFGDTKKIQKIDHLAIKLSFYVNFSIIFGNEKSYAQVHRDESMKPRFIEIEISSANLWVSKVVTNHIVLCTKLTISFSEYNFQQNIPRYLEVKDSVNIYTLRRTRWIKFRRIDFLLRNRGILKLTMRTQL